MEFSDGFPTEDTARNVFDNLDFLRGVETFLNGCPASLVAMREGMRQLGAVNRTIGITNTLMDARSLFLTPNTESIYTGTWLDLKDGPIVAESPPEAPQGKKSNWIQTVPGKGFNVILRFYGPLQSWFDQSWRPGEIEPVESGRGSKTRI
jgi:hypothetical protein